MKMLAVWAQAGAGLGLAFATDWGAALAGLGLCLVGLAGAWLWVGAFRRD